MIVLDTSVLSAVLRRKQRGPAEDALSRQVDALLRGDRQVAVPGIVLQEVLSGIADAEQGKRVLAAVHESFTPLLAQEQDHLKAAELANAAARKGVALGTPDALIAAQTINGKGRLLTTDADFGRLAGLSELRLYPGKLASGV